MARGDLGYADGVGVFGFSIFYAERNGGIVVDWMSGGMRGRGIYRFEAIHNGELANALKYRGSMLLTPVLENL